MNRRTGVPLGRQCYRRTDKVSTNLEKSFGIHGPSSPRSTPHPYFDVHRREGVLVEEKAIKGRDQVERSRCGQRGASILCDLNGTFPLRS